MYDTDIMEAIYAHHPTTAIYESSQARYNCSVGAYLLQRNQELFLGVKFGRLLSDLESHMHPCGAVELVGIEPTSVK